LFACTSFPIVRSLSQYWSYSSFVWFLVVSIIHPIHAWVCYMYMTGSSIDHADPFCVHENGVAGVKRNGWRCREQTGERSMRGDLTQRIVREGCYSKSMKQKENCGKPWNKNTRFPANGYDTYCRSEKENLSLPSFRPSFKDSFLYWSIARILIKKPKQEEKNSDIRLLSQFLIIQK